jgi:molybdate transport system ATP-binding protein
MELNAHLEKSLGKSAGIRVELSVPLEGVTALFGPSGSGKTMLLRCLAGLERVENGRIEAAGRIWLDTKAGIALSPQRRGIGFLFQEPALFPHLTVRENVRFGGAPLAPELEPWLENELELGGLAERRPRELSGGEKRRVALARVLAHRPGLLLLDEPFSGLDQPARERLRPLLRGLLRRLGIPTILVTHDRHEAHSLSDRLVLMSRGSVEAAGPVAALFERPPTLAAARAVGFETFEQASRFGRASREAACVRAEDVTLGRASASGNGDFHEFTGEIEWILREGARVRVRVNAGFPITSSMHRREFEALEAGEGERVTARLPREAVHWVPLG